MKSAAKLFAIGLGLTMAVSHMDNVEAASMKLAPAIAVEGEVVDVQSRRSRRVRRGVGIAGAIIGGAIIGGAIARERNRGYRYYDDPRPVYREPVYRAPPPRYRGGNRHVRWCLNRYRSYSPRSNTYQPYSGGRRYCRSPFG